MQKRQIFAMYRWADRELEHMKEADNSPSHPLSLLFILCECILKVIATCGSFRLVMIRSTALVLLLCRSWPSRATR